MAEYLKFLIREPVKQEILKREGKDLSVVSKKTGLRVEELKGRREDGSIDLNPDPLIKVDTLLISSRHLYRMPYSLHEKSLLASVVIDADELLSFEREDAAPEKAEVQPFLDRSKGRGSAASLLARAFDFKPEIPETEGSPGRGSFKQLEPREKIPEKFFPPCIKRILEGLSDGRKRALFVLINFLRCSGWDKDEVYSFIQEWNKRNKGPLRDAYVEGQLRHSFSKPLVLPPNCDNQAYYSDIGIKCPDCAFKNPLTRAKLLARRGRRS